MPNYRRRLRSTFTSLASMPALFLFSACTVQMSSAPPPEPAPAQPVVYSNAPQPQPQQQPPPQEMPQKTTRYYWDEQASALGPHRCANEYECDGMRFCNAHGWCEGEARPQNVQYERPIKSARYVWNEQRSALGPNRCRNEWECDGMRVCSANGWCEGEARPGQATAIVPGTPQQQHPQQQGMQDHRAEEHRAEEQRAAEHRAEEQRAEEHRAEEQRARERGQERSQEERAQEQRAAEERAREEHAREERERAEHAHDGQHEGQRPPPEHTGAAPAKGPNYHHDEASHHNHCNNDMECDGQRVCRRGTCEGRAR